MSSKKWSAEELAEVVAIVRQQMAASGGGGGGVKFPDETVAEAWAHWDRTVLTPAREALRQDKPAERRDVQTIDGYKPVILGLDLRTEAEIKAGKPERRMEFVHGDTTYRMADVKLADLTPEMGAAWMEALKRFRKYKSNFGHSSEYYSAGAVNRMLTILQGCVSYRIKNRRLNPLRGVARESIKGCERKGYFLDEEQLESFLRHADPDVVDMARLSANAGGMRKTEVLSLQIGMVGWASRSIILPPGKEHTKNGLGRSFPLLDREYDMLARRRERSEAIGTQYLFPNTLQPGGHPYDPKTIHNRWERAVAKWLDRGGALLNGERPVFHHLRHTFATWSVIKGVPVVDIMREGGWQDFAIMDGYTKTAAEAIARSRVLRGRSVKDIREATLREEALQGPGPRKGPARSPAPALDPALNSQEVGR